MMKTNCRLALCAILLCGFVTSGLHQQNAKANRILSVAPMMVSLRRGYSRRKSARNCCLFQVPTPHSRQYRKCALANNGNDVATIRFPGIGFLDHRDDWYRNRSKF
jgi:hypothetical protein